MNILLVLLSLVLCGCASWVDIKETEEGVRFESNKQFDASYKREGDKVEASASTEGKSLFEGLVQPTGQKVIE